LLDVCCRVVFDGDKAVGVEFVKDGERHIARLQSGGEVRCGDACIISCSRNGAISHIAAT
jgi:hypothetical protein